MGEALDPGMGLPDNAVIDIPFVGTLSHRLPRVFLDVSAEKTPLHQSAAVAPSPGEEGPNVRGLTHDPLMMKQTAQKAFLGEANRPKQ